MAKKAVCLSWAQHTALEHQTHFRYTNCSLVRFQENTSLLLCFSDLIHCAFFPTCPAELTFFCEESDDMEESDIMVKSCSDYADFLSERVLWCTFKQQVSCITLLDC